MRKTTWQAGFSLGFCSALCHALSTAKRAHSVELIAQSYLSLTLVFLALIPPILLPDQWGVVGWSVEGALIFMYALYRNSALKSLFGDGLTGRGRALKSVLCGGAQSFSNGSLLGAVSESFAVVAVANSVERFRQQLSFATIAFFCLQLLSATSMLFILLLDEIDSKSQVTMALLIIVLLYTVLNEWLLYRKASWSWLLPKWIGLIPLYAVAFIFLVGLSHDGIIMWSVWFRSPIVCFNEWITHVAVARARYRV